MKEKKPTYVAPHLEITVNADGVQLLRVLRQSPVSPTAANYRAGVKLHPDIRPFAVAVTLVEVAIALNDRKVYGVDGFLKEAVARLILADTPMEDLPPYDGEPPF